MTLNIQHILFVNGFHNIILSTHWKPHYKSLDTNLIKYIWNNLEKRIRKYRVSSKSETKYIFLQKWTSITLQLT